MPAGGAARSRFKPRDRVPPLIYNKAGSNGMKTKNCRLCRQHGRLLDVNRHDCPFKECDCEKCELIRTQRGIMSRQIRMRRRAAGSRAARPAVRYSCQNCQNHGIQTAKKNHQKVCPFRDCRCAACVLAAARCDVEQKVRRRCLTKPKGGESPDRLPTPPRP
ncbi:DM DNA binding domain protein [Aphelenchoides fujianensis]|nr:DM DNA binding domain protein [Aphelenchoides fujianensis]